MARSAPTQPPSATRRWVARGAALLALAAAAVAFLLAVGSVHGTHELTGEEAQGAMRQLTASNTALGDRLEALKTGASPRAAQEATRTTASLTRKLDDDADGGGDRVHGVLQAELDYLDAVGSTLNNPRSELRGRIGERAQALRDLLQHVPGGDHRVIRGGLALVQYSEARAGV